MTVAVFALEAGWLSLGLKPLKYLGTISYSIYLTHLSVLLLSNFYLSKYDMPGLVLFFINVANVIAVASITYYTIERPGIAMVKKLSAKWLNQRGDV